MARKKFPACAEYDQVDDITEARIEAWLSIDQVIELCDIDKRTWYRWLQRGAPRWAIRLVMSQRATLDRFGWKDWEIRDGVLYCKQLAYRYHWTPAHLILPLFNARDSTGLYSSQAGNVASLDGARQSRSEDAPGASTIAPTAVQPIAGAS